MTGWLVDKSALWKLPRSPEYATWIERINRGQVSISLPTRLEVAVSARDREHWPVLKRDLLSPLLDVYASPRSEAVAIQIMDALVDHERHHAVSLPDVMIAAVAAVERLTVLHDDRNFDAIREIFGGPETERLSARPAGPLLDLRASLSSADLGSAEADGNRTRQGARHPLVGFEDRGAHQEP